MKILWVKSDFLHPTTKGGHIRTLETLKRLHQRHEIHYVAFDFPEQAEGVARSSEYCSKAYPVPHRAPARTTPAFWLQLGGSLFATLPLAVSRYRSHQMRRQIEILTRLERFDALVCDFLFPAPNIPDVSSAILFEHNVEATIWKRHAEHGATPLHRAYFRSQYERMRAYEGQVCREAKRVIAVSEPDAETIRSDYGGKCVQPVPTGVDLDYFTPPSRQQRTSDLVLVGSMDWMPNIDGAEWFVTEILPLIRRKRPDCSLVIAGRKPSASILRLAENDARIRVTGTVPDVRPYLWHAGVSIVPLRIGSGTRIKIFEAMAANTPVVSTSVGAEGLDLRDGETISIADSPGDFADRCVTLLEDKAARGKMAGAAREMVSSCYSWEIVSRKFEQLLQ